MPKQFKLEQSTQMGQKVVGVTITGDKRNNEPETFRIHLPFGDVEVTRANDGRDITDTDYWVHVYVNNPTSPNYCPDGDSGAYDLPGAVKATRDWLNVAYFPRAYMAHNARLVMRLYEWARTQRRFLTV